MPARALLLALLLLPLAAAAQPADGAPPSGDRPALTLRQIMQAPETWIGAWPGAPYWTDAGDYAYFMWNPRGEMPGDSLFRVPAAGGAPERVPASVRRALPPRFEGWHQNRLAYDAAFARRVFVRDGDLYLYDLAGRTLRPLLATGEAVQNPRFAPGRTDRVVFARNNNVYAFDFGGGGVRMEQLTDLRSGRASEDPRQDAQQRLLERQQLELFDVLRERARRDSLAEVESERDRAARNRPPTYHYGDRQVQQLQVSPDERFATFVLATSEPPRSTTMTDYVTRSGFAEPLTARPKVGSPAGTFELHVQDLRRDTTYAVDLSALPGLYDPTDFQRERGLTADSARVLIPYGPFWSPDGRYAVLDVRSRDNKDRWIARLDPETGTVTSLDRQRDEAWIGGPGLSTWLLTSSLGWVPETDGSYRRVWFHSEATGHSHLYTVDVTTGRRAALTSGDFEVHAAQLSRDGRTWLLQTNEGSPYEMHLWRMPVAGGARERLTAEAGRHDGALSPDGRTLATLFSTSNRPPDVYLRPLAGAARQRVTESPTAEWLAYPWTDPEIVEVPASDGIGVPARIYRPERPNGAAVLFVHGAGYLQNVHRWWSSYFREYMFHHLLAERGYLVLDLDFRASAGYGRDWRTAVYRHMGGRDLQDYVDASLYVRERYGIPPERVGIYGGSYGGFIALMALFTEAKHFGAGAALRAVTDWAHYNEGYTSNILNTPAEDSLAFRRSSPIYFAEGLQDPLLMTHGLVDVNVQPQDIFRLSQRLIELHKEDWELAMYPVEDHGFVEPSSWHDQYRRILELFERHLHPGES